MTVAIKLSGGLGNQLFQYATGRQLAMHQGHELDADLCWFNDIPEGSTLRQPLLKHFKAKLRYVNSSGNPSTLAEPARGTLDKLLRPIRIHKEKRSYQYDSKINNISRRCRLIYLDGYWQSYKYFQDVRSTVLQDLQPDTPPHPLYEEFRHQITGTESVMIHVRRGDYIQSPSAAKVHGALDPSYYQRAIQIAESRLTRPTFYVFSDDISWCMQNISSQSAMVYVKSAPTSTAVIDELVLMQQCKHQIIANSSLSWWGAWLNLNPQKLVIAPRNWLASQPIDLADLIPPAWVIVAPG
jgi:hypothetical protein